MAAIAAILSALAILFAALGLYRWLGWTRVVDERMEETLGASTATVDEAASRSTRLNERLGRLGFGRRVEEQLIAADSKQTVSEYLTGRLVMAIAGLLVGALLTRAWWGGVIVAIGGWMVPAFMLQRRRASRLRSFDNTLPNVLDLLVGSLRAGQGLFSGLSVVAQEMPAPVGPDFERVLQEIALGYSSNEALAHLSQRVGSRDLELVVTAIQIQSEVGGNLAEVLASISDTIRDRVQLQAQIRAITASQRMTGLMLSLLPLALAIILSVINPGYMAPLFQPGWPMMILIGAIVLVAVGNLIMNRVTRLDV